jgi:glycosyltransferase involved in cell wall biosynthesis
MLTTFYPPWSFGGDAVQVQRLSRALAEAGHDVTVVHSREAYRALAPGDPEPPGADNGAPIRLVSIDAGLGRLSPLATYLSGKPLLVRRALEQALEDEFDVLHYHNPSLLGGPGVMGMGRGLRLYTLHEQWLVCPTHVLWKYRRRVCEKPDCWRCTVSYRRPPQPWRSTGMLDRAVASLDALIAPSATSAKLHARFARLAPIVRLPHFIGDAGPTPERLDPRSAHGHDAQPAVPGGSFFLYVGRLESIKGVDRLLAAFRRAPDRQLLIAGTGTSEAALRHAARDLRNVRFLGWVGGAQLDALYRDALIVPTRGHESFPLVLLEAFVRGTPAIVHRFGALAELAEESGAALTYSSEAELEAALARLAGDPELRHVLGQRARAAYLQRWTPEAHLSRYFALIADRAQARGDHQLAAAATAAS